MVAALSRLAPILDDACMHFTLTEKYDVMHRLYLAASAIMMPSFAKRPQLARIKHNGYIYGMDGSVPDNLKPCRKPRRGL